MLKKFKKQINNEKGLTLIELLAVIVILGIIAAIAVPAIGNIISNSKDKALLADASNILAGAKIAMVDGACDTGKATEAEECTQAELGSFVEGITEGTYSANKTADGWTVTYSELTNIKNKKDIAIYNTIKKAGPVSETNLNEALKK